MCSTTNQMGRLLFEGGWYSRVAFIQDFTVCIEHQVSQAGVVSGLCMWFQCAKWFVPQRLSTSLISWKRLCDFITREGKALPHCVVSLSGYEGLVLIQSSRLYLEKLWPQWTCVSRWDHSYVSNAWLTGMFRSRQWNLQMSVNFYDRMYALQVHANWETTRDLHASLWSLQDFVGCTHTCPRNCRISILSCHWLFHRQIVCENPFAVSQSSWKSANKHHSYTENSQFHWWALHLLLGTYKLEGVIISKPLSWNCLGNMILTLYLVTLPHSDFLS